jgi:hypothetical protein
MDGVTTALVGFILLCVAFPHLVKNKTQYYLSLAAVVAIILLDSLALIVFSADFSRFLGAVSGLLDVIALVGLVSACGGLSPRQLAGEMGNAFEVIRRGGDEKETIIPLGPEAHAAMAAARAKAHADAGKPAATPEQPRTVYHVDTPNEDHTIPLE